MADEITNMYVAHVNGTIYGWGTSDARALQMALRDPRCSIDCVATARATRELWDTVRLGRWQDVRPLCAWSDGAKRMGTIAETFAPTRIFA